MARRDSLVNCDRMSGCAKNEGTLWWTPAVLFVIEDCCLLYKIKFEPPNDLDIAARCKGWSGLVRLTILFVEDLVV